MKIKMQSKFILGLLTIILVGVLIVQLLKQPTFMLSSVYLTGMILIAIVILCSAFSFLLSLIIGKHFFMHSFFVSLSLAAVAFLFYLYKPTLTIIVPKGYIGAVNLVLSNVEENILSLDSNGVGYINKQTFDRTFHPIVLQDNQDISDRCVGFNPTTFWGVRTTTTSESDLEIKSLSFEIVPESKKKEKQYYHTDLTKLVNEKLIYREK